MSSLEEIGKILHKNLSVVCEGSPGKGVLYIVHRDDHVRVQGALGEYNIFKRSLICGEREVMETLSDPSIDGYDFGIKIATDHRYVADGHFPPYMKVLVRDKDGEVQIEPMKIDETLIKNAKANGVIVEDSENILNEEDTE